MINVKVHLREIIKYVLLLGVLLQSVMGLLTIVLWIGKAPTLWSGVRSLFGVSVGLFLSGLFLRMWCKEKKPWLHIWGSCGIVSIPVVLQTCLDGGMELLRFVGIFGLLLLCLFCREHFRQKWQRMVTTLLSLFFVGVFCWGGSDAPSFAARILSRTGFPYLYNEAYNISPELREKVDIYFLQAASSSAEGIYTILYPELCELHGSKEVADTVCMELAGHCIRKNTKGVVMNFLWDFAGYHFPMVVSEMQLRGMGYDSVTGVNYGELLQRLGKFTSIYWDYGVIWYLLSTMLLLFMWKKLWRTRKVGVLILLLEVSVLCMCLEGAGYFDYKNLPLVEFIRIGMLMQGLGRWKIEKDE